MVLSIRSHAGVMELADVVDSKSTAGDSVPVRVRPPAPFNRPLLIQLCQLGSVILFICACLLDISYDIVKIQKVNVEVLKFR